MDVEKELHKNKKTTDMDIGAFLIEARENKNLSTQDIASKLNLTLSMVEKIEANQFVQDTPLAFIRGYLRSYAQQVDVDTATICVEFDRQTGESEKPLQKVKMVSDFKVSRKERNSSSFLFKMITYLIVVTLLSFGGWEMWKRFGASKQKSEASFSEKVISLDLSVNEQGANQIVLNTAEEKEDHNGIGLIDSGAPATVSAGTESTGGSTSKASTAKDPTDKTPTDSNVASSTNEVPVSVDASASDAKLVEQDNTIEADLNLATTENLNTSVADSASEPAKEPITGPIVSASFVFSGDCWVRISDANGEVLAIGIKPTGKVMPIEGIAPLSVTLGNPAVVSVTYQEESYDLSRFRPGKSAQFILE